MLYEDLTTGAIVAARRVDTGDPLSAGQAEAIQDALSVLNEKHGVSVTLFIPGDSATDHADDPDMELYTPELYFGFSAVDATPEETPCRVTLEQIRAANEHVAKIPDAFWQELASTEGVPDDVASTESGLFLMSYGPLPYAVLAFGVTHPSDQQDGVKYKFFSCQDMSQEWLPEGVDGVEIAGVEFDSVASLELTADTLGELAKTVSQLEAPDLYLTVRYD